MTPDPAASPSDRHRSHPGSFFLGRYRVVEEIAAGGMATVHLGRLDGPGGFQKWVAIKRIHRHLAGDDGFVRMFLDEARIAARISHPNVAQVFELGAQGPSYWIAMEYLHGEPLRELVRAYGEHGHPAMPPAFAAKIVADAAEGLHAAHELRDARGQPLELVHRDVSPHNIFLTFDGAVKVVDFGIAKGEGRLASTRAGVLKGKLAYMSPEQARGGRVDRRTDVFALGVVLWELVTGQRLFGGGSDLQALQNVAACVVPRPSSLCDAFPLELEAIILRALAKRRSDRYGTARQLSRALGRYLMHAGAFVGFEELGAHVRRALPGRFHAREALLRWAGDMTETRAPAPPAAALVDLTLHTLVDAPTFVDPEPAGAEEGDHEPVTRVLARPPPVAPTVCVPAPVAVVPRRRPRRWRWFAATTTLLLAVLLVVAVV